MTPSDNSFTISPHNFKHFCILPFYTLFFYPAPLSNLTKISQNQFYTVWRYWLLEDSYGSPNGWLELQPPKLYRVFFFFFLQTVLFSLRGRTYYQLFTDRSLCVTSIHKKKVPNGHFHSNGTPKRYICCFRHMHSTLPSKWNTMALSDSWIIFFS